MQLSGSISEEQKSAHSFTPTGFTRGYKQVVVLDEYYCKKRINPKQLQDDFIDFVKRAQSKFKVYEAYCDSAEADFDCRVRDGL